MNLLKENKIKAILEMNRLGYTNREIQSRLKVSSKTIVKVLKRFPKGFQKVSKISQSDNESKVNLNEFFKENKINVNEGLKDNKITQYNQIDRNQNFYSFFKSRMENIQNGKHLSKDNINSKENTQKMKNIFIGKHLLKDNSNSKENTHWIFKGILLIGFTILVIYLLRKGKSLKEPKT